MPGTSLVTAASLADPTSSAGKALRAAFVPRLTSVAALSASRNITDQDLTQYVRSTHTANLLTLTVPVDSPQPIGATVDLARRGAGDLLVQPATGVTLYSPGNRRTVATQNNAAQLLKTAANEWELVGDLAILTVLDTFTDANNTGMTAHVSDRGHPLGQAASWDQPGANGFTVFSTGRAQAAGSQSRVLHKTSPGLSSFDVSSDIYFNAATAGHFAGPLAAVDTALTGYYARYNTGSTRWELQQLVAGTETNLGFLTATVNTGETHTLRLSVSPTSVALYIDGVLAVQSAAVTLSPNRWGLYGSFSSHQPDKWTGTAGA